MFAFLFHEKLTPFYENITSFPTIVFSFLLIFCFLYWTVAVLGLIEFDFLDFDIPESVNSDGGMSNVNVLAGLFMKLGLHGVPFPLTMSLISLIGWMLCYYAVHFISPYIPTGIIRVLVGIPIFLATLYLATVITSKIIHPLRPMFKAADQEVQKRILGQIAIVRTTRVDKKFGEANVDDGGAGLIVKVRSFKDEEFKRGDRVVLLEHVAEENIYKVIAESEFNK